MSKLYDQWVSMAIADDTLVAHQLLLLRCHHLSPVNPWTCRQRRTTRLPVAADRASPTTPLTWIAATSLDGFEGSTRPIAPMRSSEPKTSDKTATFADETKSSSSKKKRTLAHLRRLEQEKKDEGKNLRDELEATYLKYDRRIAEGERLKKTKKELWSRKQDHIVENESPASDDGKSGGQQPRIFLPDLNEAPVEYFTEFIGFNQ
ncbi:uncharacterized protein HKW66_Vig0165100 [Vigna angularis]|uniref:No apical meristem-associated C-terminal domain-containing protein n=2 Tax=Phaseolus angularis TaxID=3914 RepID=A0A8T0JPY8_PHAAN|nr:uncharacterized protein HKW66_Vig0165100 [Vigna angularis]BAT98608.1 hypothetical protein VIGAN_09227500 [Vigna angularis var. angularis]